MIFVCFTDIIKIIDFYALKNADKFSNILHPFESKQKSLLFVTFK